MRNRQRGVTVIGWLFLLIPIAIVVYAGIRLAPIYLNYMKVAHGHGPGRQRSSSRRDANAARPSATALDKHFDDRDASSIPTSRTSRSRSDGADWVIEASYDDQAPLFAQRLAALVAFDKAVHDRQRRR